MKTFFDKQNTSLNLVLLLFALFAVFFFASVSQKQHETRGRAQSSGSTIQSKCVGDKVHFSVSYTNQQSYLSDLDINVLLADGSLAKKSYNNIAIGSSINDTVATNHTTVKDGLATFSSYPTDPTITQPTKAETVYYKALICGAAPTITPTPFVPAGPTQIPLFPTQVKPTEEILPTEILGADPTQKVEPEILPTKEIVPQPSLMPTFSCLGACTTLTPEFIPPTETIAPIEPTIAIVQQPVTQAPVADDGLLQLLIQLIINLITALFNN